MARSVSQRDIPVDGAGNPVDLKKWSFDSRSGEFFRVSYDGGKVGRLLDVDDYSKRRVVFLKNHDLANMYRKWVIGFFISSVISFFLWINGSIGFGATTAQAIPCIIGYFGLIISVPFAFFSGIKFMMLKSKMAPGGELDPGPKPYAPKGSEQVDQEKAHGAGGTLTGDRLKAAARGGKQHAGRDQPLQTFND